MDAYASPEFSSHANKCQSQLLAIHFIRYDYRVELSSVLFLGTGSLAFELLSAASVMRELDESASAIR